VVQRPGEKSKISTDKHVDPMEGIRGVSESAFRMLVEEHQAAVFRTCLGILHNRNDADDICQEVFIEVYRSIDNFRAGSKLSTWLYRIAVNKSLNHLRAGKRKRFYQTLGLIPISELPVEEPSYDLMDQNTKEADLKINLDKAIESLPDKQRAAFVLHKIEDLSYKEISEIMKVSLSSIESLLFRAKRNLQKQLLQYYQKMVSENEFQ
jgi:RNA polymerase sigma-70 factor, ECF subfamily